MRLLTGADFWALHDEPAIGLRRDRDLRRPGRRARAAVGRAHPVGQRPLADRAGRDLGRAAHRAPRAAAGLRGARARASTCCSRRRSTCTATPLGGRVFECFSEDPLLTGRIGAAYVRGLQAEGVAATVKHFVANDSETERFTLDARVGERALRELYLAPFELILAEHPWAVMAAYNARQRDDDDRVAAAARGAQGRVGLGRAGDVGLGRGPLDTDGAGEAALDLAMPGPDGPFGDALVAAVRDGRVSEAAVDDKVAAARCASPRASARSTAPPRRPARLVRRRDRGRAARHRRRELRPRPQPRHAAAARRALAAQASPCSGPTPPSRARSAAASATVFPHYTVSPLDGLRAALPHAEVTHAPGVRTHTRPPVAPTSSADVRFLAADGTRARRRAPRDRRVHVARDARPGTSRRSRSTRRCARPSPASTSSAARAPGRYRLTLDGDAGLRRASSRCARTPTSARRCSPRRSTACRSRSPRARRSTSSCAARSPTTRMVSFQLNFEPPFGDADERARAGRRARARGRRRDRRRRHDAPRSRARASTAPRSPCPAARTSSCGASTRRSRAPSSSSTPARRCCCRGWTRCPRVLLCWFPGQEAGNALADVLLRRRRARRAAADDLAGVRGRPAVGDAGRRRPALRRGPGDRLPRRASSRCCRSATGSATRAGSTWRWTARPCGWSTPARAAAARSSRSTRRAPTARSSGRRAGSSASPSIEADAGEEVVDRHPARAARVPALGRRLADRAGRRSCSRRAAPWPTCGVRVPTDGAEAARVLRRGRAPQALHARRRGALRHPARALAADPPAGGRARAARCCGGRRAASSSPRRARTCWSTPRRCWPRSRAARADMDRHTGVSRGVVRVAATAADAPRLPEALADFHGDHPGIQIGLRQGSAAEIVALVARGRGRRRGARADRGAAAGVDVHPLADEPLRVAVAGRRRARGHARRAGRAARAPVHPRRAGHGAARDRDGAPRRPRGSARCRCSRSATRGRCATSCGPGWGSASCPRAGSSGRGRSSARRICAIRRATGCQLLTPAAGDLTGRPAPARAPARALTPGACAAASRRASGPARRCWKSMKVGIDITPYWAATAWLSSTSSLTIRRSSRLAAISSRIGFMARHGGHQAAVKSTSTGWSDSRTSAVKVASVTASIRMPHYGSDRAPSQVAFVMAAIT